MKKIIKNVSLAMALVAGATLATPAIAQVNVHAAPVTPSCDVVANYLQIQNFKATANVGEEYTFSTHSLLGAASAGTVEIALKDPYGKIVTLDAGNKFTPAVQGKYVATYTVTNGANTATADFEITVKGVSKDVSLVLPANSEHIIPTKVATMKADGDANTITLPNAILKDAKGNVLDATSAGIDVSITATATNGATPTISGNVLTLDKTVEKATYKVRYEARESGKLIAYKVVEILAEEGYKAPDYKYNYDSTKPTTAEIGVEKILPGVVATSTKDDSKVNVYYQVEVKHKNQTYTTETPNQKVLKVNEDGKYVFTAHAEGDYTITYKIEDFTGKTPSTDSTSFIISDVKDNTAPTPIVTLPYEAEDGTDVDAIEVFNEVWTGNDIMLLPIYATDSANGFVADNLTLYRQIVNKTNNNVIFDESVYGNKNQYAHQALVFNASTTLADRTVSLNGESVTIDADDMHAVAQYESEALALEDGTYIVKYIAKDKLSGHAEVTLTLSLVVDSNYDPAGVTATPTVKFATTSAIPTSANPEEVITFDAPTATQEKVGNFADTHLTTQVKYQTSLDGTTWVDGTEDIIAYDEDADEYTLTIPTLAEINTAGYKQIKLIATSTNDAGNIGTAEKVIKILGTGDGEATTITDYDTSVSANGKVGEQTALPTVEYTDDLTKNVNVEVSIVDKDGNAYTAQNMLYELTADTLTAKNAYFVPEAEGEYTVTYVSTDANNNKTVIVFSIVVGANPETFDADFVNLPSTINGGTAELGERIDLPNIETYVTSEDYLESSMWRIEVEGPANYATDHETYITFNQVGDYTIKFVCDVTAKIAFDANGESYAIGDTFKTIESKTYTVKASDTKGPEILNMTELEDKFFDLNKNGALDKGTNIKLPLPEANDVVWEKSTIAVVGSAVTYETITLDAEGIEKATVTGITLAKDAVYQFIYTLYDANGNSTMIDTFTVDVGDVEAPELVVESGVVKKSYGLKDAVIVDMSKITASDNQDGDNLIVKDDDTGEYKLKAGTLKITVKNNTTAEVFESDDDVPYNQNKLAFQFSGLTAGEYTLTVSLTDTSTKVATNTEVTFTVTESATEAVTGEEVLGVVLIVVSVLMLGGVISYFVITRKKYNKYN